MSDPFYRAFEERYRGDRSIIGERLKAYLPFITPLTAIDGPLGALDVGCGRGEWLELAAATGFDARGVDLDDGMLAACRERGLAVENADAIATLRALPDASLAIVSAFHVVEHIGFDDVRTLVAEALRALRPGGLLILETPNPENLVVGASTFYRDPSHVRPIPPELLAFSAEYAGFARQRVVRLQEAPELRAAPQVNLQNVLDGVSPDYAVVAQKAAPAAVLAQFDAAFAPARGLSLEMLAQRYDEQAARQRGALDTARALADQGLDQLAAARDGLAHLEAHVLRDGAALATRVGQAHARIDGAEARMGEADARVAAGEARLGQAEARIGEGEARLGAGEARMAEINARLEAAEARADAMGQRVIDLMSSSSWRITAPLRRAGALAYRLRAAVRNGTLGASLRRRLRAAVLGVGRMVLRNRAAKRAVRPLLARFPALQARLRAAMFDAPLAPSTPGAPPPAEQRADDLSPRARRLYAELQHAIENKDR
jgi:SAM-dependent methyltransferase